MRHFVLPSRTGAKTKKAGGMASEAEPEWADSLWRIARPFSKAVAKCDFVEERRRALEAERGVPVTTFCVRYCMKAPDGTCYAVNFILELDIGEARKRGTEKGEDRFSLLDDVKVLYRLGDDEFGYRPRSWFPKEYFSALLSSAVKEAGESAPTLFSEEVVAAVARPLALLLSTNAAVDTKRRELEAAKGMPVFLACAVFTLQAPDGSRFKIVQRRGEKAAVKRKHGVLKKPGVFSVADCAVVYTWATRSGTEEFERCLFEEGQITGFSFT